MSERRGVRVVKRGERERKLADEVKAGDDVKGGGRTPDSAREIDSTVSAWVRDFRSRSEAEAKQSFESLFEKPARHAA